MKPNRIILIRHGESEGNIDRNKYRTIPDYALNLTPKGIEQAQSAGHEIKKIIGRKVCMCTYPRIFEQDKLFKFTGSVRTQYSQNH